MGSAGLRIRPRKGRLAPKGEGRATLAIRAIALRCSTTMNATRPTLSRGRVSRTRGRLIFRPTAVPDGRSAAKGVGQAVGEKMAISRRSAGGNTRPRRIPIAFLLPPPIFIGQPTRGASSGSSAIGACLWESLTPLVWEGGGPISASNRPSIPCFTVTTLPTSV